MFYNGVTMSESNDSATSDCSMRKKLPVLITVTIILVLLLVEFVVLPLQQTVCQPHLVVALAVQCVAVYLLLVSQQQATSLALAFYVMTLDTI
jgi:hypothetical protein